MKLVGGENRVRGLRRARAVYRNRERWLHTDGTKEQGGADPVDRPGRSLVSTDAPGA